MEGSAAAPTMTPPSAKSKGESSSPSLLRLLKRYAFPLLTLSLGIIWQTVVLPQTFPKSHYEVLGVESKCTAEEIAEAYQRLKEKWHVNMDAEVIDHVIEVQHAYELLSHPLMRRDYDLFNIDELKDAAKIAKELNIGKPISSLQLPVPDIGDFDLVSSISKQMTAHNFQNLLEDKETWLILVYSNGSDRSRQFAASWQRIVFWLDGVASTGVVEISEYQLAASLAETHRVTGRPFFRYGLPSLVAFTSKCRSLDCIERYSGELTVDAVVDWTATHLLRLPRISYYTSETLIKEFLQKAGLHKVKVIIFSQTGQRAPPFIRKLARDYSEHAAFGYVLWTEETATQWMNYFGLDSAPAVVFLKDPGVQPVIHYGAINSIQFQSLMEQHKTHVLPQLRSINSKDLGCDARGYSRAGSDVSIWYCVIVTGRHSPELSRARAILREVQENLTKEDIPDIDSTSVSTSLIASHAFKQKRLTITWLDGELQKKYCFFFLDSPDVFETCGPKRYIEVEDRPKLFVIRFERNESAPVVENKRRFKSVLDSFKEETDHLASQLVSRYEGVVEVNEVLSWISKTVKDGDASTLPYFRINPPDLIPEETKPLWSDVGSFALVSNQRTIKERAKDIIISTSDFSMDPRIGPFFFLVTALYIGQLWLKTKVSERQRKQAEKPSVRQNFSQGLNSAEIPPGAYQALETDSDSEAE